MSRLLFALILSGHGAVHTLGFAKSAGSTSVDLLTLPVSKPLGALWMTCAFLFVLSAASFLSRRDHWWMIALPAVLVSQLLIVRFWADAQLGTAVNALILIAILAGIARWRFRALAHREAATLHRGISAASVRVDAEMLEPLPVPVARWLERAGVVGRPLTRTAHLRQSGEMRTSPGGKWMPVRAEQWFTAERPGFVWLADVQAAPGLHIAGRDTCIEGQGRMLIRAISAYTLADSAGPEIDQGAMVRFLAEIVWLPSAALRGHIQWKAVDDTCSEATLTHGGVTVSAQFAFDSNGDPVGVTAKRYYARDGGATLETWQITIDPAHAATFQGLRLPGRATVTWKLPEGDFEWYHVEVENVVYNAGV